MISETSFNLGEIGQIIKDGELKEVVRAPNYEGRTIPFGIH